ncbi:MAG: glycosyl transferase [Bacteroidales bacterium]|nr:glycosyl transferase [Bacteroidales bacterium]
MKLRYILYTILLILPFVFRDYTPNNELRYISIVDEALNNHSLFAFYNHGEAYADKPPFYFWMMMLARVLAGEHYFWLYGLFSVLPAIGIVMLMNRWIRKEQSYSNYRPAGELLLTTGIFMGGALVLRMDMLMTLFIVLSLYTFYRIYHRKNKPYEKWILPVYIFLGLFTKGPIGLLIPLVSIITYIAVKRDWRQLGRCFGWRQFMLLITLCLIWFLFIYWEGGKDYLHNILFRQTIGRGINSFHHKAPFYYYLQTMIYTFAPWSLVYIVLLWFGYYRNRFVSDVECFFLSVILSSLVLLSVISAKIDIYLLPIYPFVVYLAVLQFDKIPRYNKIMKFAVVLPLIVFALLFPLSFFVLDYLPFPCPNPAILRAALFVLMICSLIGLSSVRKNSLRKALMAGSVGILFMIGIASFGIAQFNAYIGIKELGHVADKLVGEYDVRCAYYRFREGENLDVYVKKAIPLKMDSVELLQQATQKDSLLFIVREADLNEEKLSRLLRADDPVERVGEYNLYILGRKK